MRNKSPEVVIYTDGGCAPNPGVGGWAAILRYGDKEKTLSGGAAETTNNRMELTAAVNALSALTRRCNVRLFTDSQYLRQGVTEWLPAWKRRGWKRGQGELKNLDLWKRLDALSQKHSIQWRWVQGHSGDPANDRCHNLVRQAIQAQRCGHSDGC